MTQRKKIIMTKISNSRPSWKLRRFGKGKEMFQGRNEEEQRVGMGKAVTHFSFRTLVIQHIPFRLRENRTSDRGQELRLTQETTIVRQNTSWEESFLTVRSRLGRKEAPTCFFEFEFEIVRRNSLLSLPFTFTRFIIISVLAVCGESAV